MVKIGVLALQGDFREHRQMLDRLGVQASEVRLPQDLDGVSGLILPGGESTAIVRLMRTSGLLEELQRLSRAGLPMWGTCAGMILLAKRLDASGMPALQAMDEDRAPVIEAVGPGVELLGRLPDGTVVAAREGLLLATSFHPELTIDTRLHQYFLDRIVANR
jgi:5'-phosphate synthase pdxT subunit